MMLADSDLRPQENAPPAGPPQAGRDAADPAPVPRGLLWSTGAIAFVLAAAAFLLWGRNGAAWILDVIVAWCG
jgi:hypothetical protein